MAEKRKICVVTGTRAEYGLLYWLMREIQEDPDLALQIIATGMHLSPEFGLTYQKIEEDGFRIDEKVEMLLSSDTPVGISKSIGLGVIGFADALARLKPDILSRSRGSLRDFCRRPGRHDRQNTHRPYPRWRNYRRGLR